MAKPELGTKRLCAACGAKSYDLNHDPITCPKCGTVHEVAPVPQRGGRPEVPARPVAQEAELPETQEAEFISLEEADAEAQGKKKGQPGEEIPDVEEEVEMDESLDAAAFIEETEEEDAAAGRMREVTPPSASAPRPRPQAAPQPRPCCDCAPFSAARPDCRSVPAETDGPALRTAGTLRNETSARTVQMERRSSEQRALGPGFSV